MVDMSDQFLGGHMLDMFIFETTQLLEQLEACILDAEKEGVYTMDVINEIFRIMHTIKGSSAMMRFDEISSLAHSIEDLFYYLREENPGDVGYSELSDLVLAGVDFVKSQIEKIRSGFGVEGDASELISDNREFLARLKGQNTAKGKPGPAGGGKAAEKKDPYPQKDPATIKQEPNRAEENGSSGTAVYPGCKYKNSFRAVIRFQEGCEMENIRAFGIIHTLEDIAGEFRHVPEDIMAPGAAEIIKQNGFVIQFRTDCSYVDIHQLLMQTVFLKELELEQFDEADASQETSDTHASAEDRKSDFREDRIADPGMQVTSREHTSHQNGNISLILDIGGLIYGREG